MVCYLLKPLYVRLMVNKADDHTYWWVQDLQGRIILYIVYDG